MTTEPANASPVNGLDAISRESRTALATLRGYVEILEEELEDRGIEMLDEFRHMEGALLSLLHAIGRLEAHAEQADRKATRDVLTGLPNRRHLFHVGEELMNQGGALCAVLLDLDDFKWINDSLGHHAGDAVLVEFANRVRQALRSDDLVCRLAGDEFVVLLPGATYDVGLRVAERIRSSVGDEVLPMEGHDLRLSASLGVAARQPEHLTLDDLLRVADHGMYEAKRARKEARIKDAARLAR